MYGSKKARASEVCLASCLDYLSIPLQHTHTRTNVLGLRSSLPLPSLSPQMLGLSLSDWRAFSVPGHPVHQSADGLTRCTHCLVWLICFSLNTGSIHLRALLFLSIQHVIVSGKSGTHAEKPCQHVMTCTAVCMRTRRRRSFSLPAVATSPLRFFPLRPSAGSQWGDRGC